MGRESLLGTRCSKDEEEKRRGRSKKEYGGVERERERGKYRK